LALLVERYQKHPELSVHYQKQKQYRQQYHHSLSILPDYLSLWQLDLLLQNYFSCTEFQQRLRPLLHQPQQDLPQQLLLPFSFCYDLFFFCFSFFLLAHWMGMPFDNSHSSFDSMFHYKRMFPDMYLQWMYHLV